MLAAACLLTMAAGHPYFGRIWCRQDRGIQEDFAVLGAELARHWQGWRHPGSPLEVK